MADDDLVYMLRRAADEKRLAAAAGSEEARIVHQRLAGAYEQKVREVDPSLPGTAPSGADV